MRIPLTIVSLVSTLLIMISCTANQGSFFLINHAKEPISHAIVVVCGQTVELNDIQPTKNAQGSYKVNSDSHYDIKIEFQSGKKLEEKMGYVTNGFDFHHEFVVTDTGIEILKKNDKK